MKKFPAVLCLTFLCGAFTLGADKPAESIPLQQRLHRLESRVESAEAIRNIKRLQYAYGHYAEFGLWNDLADLFAENGVGHYPSGTLGKDAIRKLFLTDIGKGKLGLVDGMFYPHFMLEPVVTLAPGGKAAKGRWRVLAMLGNFGSNAVWAGGIYENEYVLEKGVWKIKDLHYYSRYTGLYEQPGWTTDKEATPVHYTPAMVGVPIPESASVLMPDQPTASPQDLRKHAAMLQHRVRQLVDAQEVENLQRIYGYYVDRKMWDHVADLFAPDASMELGLQGVYVGKASIRRALDQYGAGGLREGELNDHLQLQTIVTVEPGGRMAKARSTELTMWGINGKSAEWREGTFENEFVKRNGTWQIKSLRFFPRLITDYSKGWARDAQPAPGPSKEFPPDRPPANHYPIFPKFFIPPFHFSNPVTGLAPQYPGATRSNHHDRPDRTPRNEPRLPAAASLPDAISETERMLGAAVAYDASENLASAYGYYLDDFMWDETADLFTLDAKRDLSGIGVDTGRENIRESLKRRYPGKKSYEFLIAHQLIQPVIHVASDGQSTKMRVRLFQLAGASGGSGSWISGIYECSTAVEGGVWKLSGMDLDYTWTADYKRGWADIDANAKGIVSTPFPKIIEVPFHYSNPVSGRK